MTITDDAIQQTIAQFGPVIENLACAILTEREARVDAETERNETRALIAAISEAFDGGETPADQLPYAIVKVRDVEAARWTKMRDERESLRAEREAVCAALAPVFAAEEGATDELSIEEAIEHSMQVADSYAHTVPDCKCATEHRQLARWLHGLVSARNALPELRRILGE